ncbi:heme exporter protein CcmD [Zhongshania marina]|uniref:Heme exporter protein D n=1 Tax=Zhongshania marina TaxID=2304603 RepID=A0ABX9W895_9GAMM|nr:heme exporter protein CcmD [Zhongshania marina]
MYFESFSDLLNMSGHGLYVWFCYGVSALVLSILVGVARSRRKQAEQQIRAIVRRKKASTSSTSQH